MNSRIGTQPCSFHTFINSRFHTDKLSGRAHNSCHTHTSALTTFNSASIHTEPPHLAVKSLLGGCRNNQPSLTICRDLVDLVDCSRSFLDSSVVSLTRAAHQRPRLRHHGHQWHAQCAHQRPLPSSHPHRPLCRLHMARRARGHGEQSLHRHVRRTQRCLSRPSRHPSRPRHVQVPLQALTRRVLCRATAAARAEPVHSAVLGRHRHTRPTGYVCYPPYHVCHIRLHDHTRATTEKSTRVRRHHSER